MVNIKKLITSFSYAVMGIRYAFTRDQNLRIHLFAALIVIAAGILLQVNAFEIGILGVMILLVMCAEMINSTIEQMVDLITTEHKKQAEIAKDVSAGMVLITVIGSVIVGALIFTPYLIKLFFH